MAGAGADVKLSEVKDLTRIERIGYVTSRTACAAAISALRITTNARSFTGHRRRTVDAARALAMKARLHATYTYCA